MPALAPGGEVGWAPAPEACSSHHFLLALLCMERDLEAGHLSRWNLEVGFQNTTCSGLLVAMGGLCSFLCLVQKIQVTKQLQAQLGPGAWWSLFGTLYLTSIRWESSLLLTCQQNHYSDVTTFGRLGGWRIRIRRSSSST